MNKSQKPLVLFVVLLAILIAVVLAQIFKQHREIVETQAARIAALEVRVALADSRQGDLLRYARANANLPSMQNGETRVVFLGDSITDNWDNEGYGGFFPEKLYINRGIGGETTLEMLGRFRQDVIALKPRAVVILAGTNDLAFNLGNSPIEAVSNNLASMAELASLHKIRVILASVLPVSDYNQSPEGESLIQTAGRPPAKIIELNEAIKKYAERNGHIYLDYHSAMIDEKGMLKAEFAIDGLHPNAKGYAVMTQLTEQAIEKSLSGKTGDRNPD
jgi:lysophospholipase L1-like esterase